jgi:5-methylcytosine-specific restriction endonuclease McrA
MSKVRLLATYPAEEILSQVKDKAKIELTVGEETYSLALCSVRLKTFKRSPVCVCCGKKGTLMGLDLPCGHNKPHLNLYHISRKGKPLLMTRDHIIPRCLGGRNHISNMQTMCTVCNGKKGSKTPEEYEIYLKARRDSKPKKR